MNRVFTSLVLPLRVMLFGAALASSAVAETGVSPALSPVKARDGDAQILGLGSGGPQFLHPDVAFVLSVDLLPGKVVASWRIAEHYYLYRERMAIELVGPEARATAALHLPVGKLKADAYLGRTEVYYDQAWAELPIEHNADGSGRLTLRVRYQGCADAGLCYPPITRNLEFPFPVTQP